MRLSLAYIAVLATTAQAAIVALMPGGEGLAYKTGEDCPLSYQIDLEGTWKSMSIDLFSGSATELVNVTHVASGIDATVGDGKFSFKCPDVLPNSAIYFYQFTQEGAPSPVWTSRFTIAAANGSTTAPEHAVQPDGSAVPWGVGSLLSNSSSNITLTANSSSNGTLTSNSTSPWPSSEEHNSSIAFLELGACTVDQHCPETAPCCSQWGFCGTGRNCLSGCNPLASFKPQACAPIPACETNEYAFKQDSAAPRILVNGSSWNGDALTYDWVIDSVSANETEITDDDELRLSISSANNRTSVSSTRSMLFGNVSITLKPTSEAGIVTSFSLVSGTQDEIIYEFTSNASSAGTAYYHRGAVGEHSAAVQVNADRSDDDAHEYGIIWTPEDLIWTFDGEQVRNISRNSTLNATTGHYDYPMNPSRIQLLIWTPVGHDAGNKSIIDWAGGLLRVEDAETESLSSYGETVNVKCYDPLLVHWAQSNSTNSTELATSTSTYASSGSMTQDGGSSASQISGEPSPTTTQALWWTPSVTAWWTPPTAGAPEASAATPAAARRIRRVVRWLKKRAEQVPSYSYGAIGADGQPTVSIGNAVTTIADGSTTGLTMQPPVGASAPLPGSATGTAGPSSASGSHTGTASSSSASSTETGKTLSDKWNALPDAARIGIYVGAGLVGVALVILVAFLWRLASRSRASAAAAQGQYKPIGDQGEMIQNGPAYTGTGEIVPGQDLYQGGVAPAAAPRFPGGFKKSLRRPKPEGGIPYTPPPEAMQQYAPRY